MSLSLYSFPKFDNGDDVKKLCKKYKTYPFFDENTYGNPNFIGLSALLKNDNGKICSYNYLSDHNIIITYCGENLCDNVSIKNGGIRHQIINNGDIINSGIFLYDKLSTVNPVFTVEYISDGFNPISLIPESSFSGKDVKTVKFPYNSNGLKIGDKAFSGCTQLEEFYCYHGIESVGASAFTDCTSLFGNEISCNHKIAISCEPGAETIDDINIYLSDCIGTDSNYHTIDFSKKLKICFDCGDSSFRGCTNISGITFLAKDDSQYNQTNYLYYGNNNVMTHQTPFVYRNGSTTYPTIKLGKYAFSNCTSLSSITSYYIKTESEDIKIDEYDNTESMWTNCEYKLRESDNAINIPKNVIMFYEDSVHSENNVNAIGCFANCVSLNGYLWFEDVLETGIPEGAFSGCTGIKMAQTSSHSLSSTSLIGDNAFKGTAWASASRADLEKLVSHSYISNPYGLCDSWGVSGKDSEINRIFGLNNN